MFPSGVHGSLEGRPLLQSHLMSFIRVEHIIDQWIERNALYDNEYVRDGSTTCSFQ
jgi:hypothetical protein